MSLVGIKDNIKEYLSHLDGIINTTRITGNLKDKIIRNEKRYERTCAVPVINLAVSSVLNNDNVYVILKDETFRKPENPTFFLVQDAETPEDNPGLDDCMRHYTILGEEFMGQEIDGKEKKLSLGDTLVLHKNKKRNKAKASFFVLPPLGFPELECVSTLFGITDILSASPSPLSDDLLRTAHGLRKDKKYATLLISFNSEYYNTSED